MTKELQTMVQEAFSTLNRVMNTPVGTPGHTDMLYNGFRRLYVLLEEVHKTCNQGVIGRIYPFSEGLILTPEQTLYFHITRDIVNTVATMEKTNTMVNKPCFQRLSMLRTVINTNDFGCYGAVGIFRNQMSMLLTEMEH